MMKRRPDIEARLLPDGYVLLHSTRENWVHTLTPVGGLVWEFCDGTNSVDSIVDQIAQLNTGIAVTDLQTQIAALMVELKERKLLTEEEESAGLA